MTELPVSVRLAQISQRVGENYYLPYSVGLLQAYAQAHLSEPGRFVFLPPLYKRMLRDEGLAALAGVDIVGFSVYVWNIRRSLMLAQAHKQARPQALIILGGPQVPDRAEDFLREHPFVDLVTHGAGEEVFRDLLENYPSRDWRAIAGVSWIDAQGDFHHRPPAARKRDLSDYPSPFLSGVFDPLLAEHGQWYTPFETNRGCPFSCTFCDWGSAIASKVVRFDEQRLWREIAWLGQQRIRSVFCADANFGILPRDVEIAAEMARVRATSGYPQAFQIQTAKNVTERVVEIQKILTRSGLSAAAAISLQSLDTATLRSIKRENISLEAYARMQQECLAAGIFAYTDIIMGLPGESYDSFVSGIEAVIESGQFNKIIFHDATLLPNAELSQPASRARYGLETAEVLVPAHTVLADGVPELMEIVVATASLPRLDWIRTHVYAWMTAFLFYTHKLLQLVLLVLRQQLGCSWQNLIGLFAEGDLSAYPVLQRIQRTFDVSARRQQLGYPHSQSETLVLTPLEGTYFTPDLSMQLQLGNEGLIDSFYAEAGSLLLAFAQARQPDFPVRLLQDALRLNRRFFIQTFQRAGFALRDTALAAEALQLAYDLPAYYQARLRGIQPDLAPKAPMVFSL